MKQHEALNVLLVEDDPRLAETWLDGLRENGYEVHHAGTCAAARALTTTTPPDFVLLDLGLPDGDGLSLLAEFRALPRQPHVLITSARDALADRVLGLDGGADDYITKPVSFPELLARLRAFQRRRVTPAETSVLRLACLTIDLIGREVTCGTSRIELTPREFDLLACLARRPGEIVTRALLAEEVWKSSKRFTPLDNLIDVNVSRLRTKLVENGCKLTLHTLRGVGFRLDLPA
jgi:two-component system, OmpR family, copper resistance phosphate regulon response regulator CusR